MSLPRRSSSLTNHATPGLEPRRRSGGSGTLSVRTAVQRTEVVEPSALSRGIAGKIDAFVSLQPNAMAVPLPFFTRSNAHRFTAPVPAEGRSATLRRDGDAGTAEVAGGLVGERRPLDEPRAA